MLVRELIEALQMHSGHLEVVFPEATEDGWDHSEITKVTSVRTADGVTVVLSAS